MLISLVAALSPDGGQQPKLEDVNDLSSTIGTTGDRPQVSIRFNTDGTIDEATGDTGTALSYSQTGNWLIGDEAPDDASDWEVQLTIVTEDIGDPGTFTGDTTGSYVALSSTRTFTWTKDGTDTGTAGADVQFDLRQVSETSNSAQITGIDLDCQITP